MKSIVFQHPRIIGSHVSVLVLAPLGSRYHSSDAGAAIFGSREWTLVNPPLSGKAPSAIPRYLIGTGSFSFDAIPGSWQEFLDSIYGSVDMVLFYSGMGEQFYEMPRQNLELRKPEKYTYSFFEFQAIPHIPQKEEIQMANDNVTTAFNAVHSLLSAGWTAAAISTASGVNPITIGSIKNSKSKRVTNKVLSKLLDVKSKADQNLITPPPRKRKATAAVAAKPAPTPRAKPGPKPKAKPGPKSKAKPGPKSRTSAGGSIINTNYVPVNVAQLQAAIDSMIKNFSGAIADLEAIRKQLKV